MSAVVIALAGLVATWALAWAPVAAAAPSCRTPPSPDRHEPPCNPYLGSRVWSTNHRLPYAQGSSPLRGPTAADNPVYQHEMLGENVPVIIQVSAPYPDGRRTIWASTVGVPEYRTVYKLDYETLAPIDSIDIRSDGTGEEARPIPSTSGVYNVLTRRNRLVVLRERSFAIYGDVRPRRSGSPIRLLHHFRLPRRAFCRSTDRVIGVQVLYSSEVVFVTVQGMLGIVPAQPRRMRARNLVVKPINGRRCRDTSVPESALEEVSNSLAADERGGIYPVTTKAQYKYRWRGGRLRRVWRARYESGGGTSGATLSAGSGSTPTVMGTRRGADKFIVITDGQELMHLVLFWRDRIPRGWKPIAPGKPRRIACEVPVTFGDPDATSSKSEQSVLVRGYGSVVVNNALALDRFFSLLPPGIRPIAALTGNAPGNGPTGVQRIDWDPRTRSCRSVWANPEASIPNSIPTMSARSRMVYGMGVKNGSWGLLGLDWASGAERLWVPATPSPGDNSFFAATVVGAGRTILNGTIGGITAFRPPR